jgi:hypothetical protein
MMIKMILKTEVKPSRYRQAGDKGDRKCNSYSFFISALDGGEWSASCSAVLYSREKEPHYHWIGGWVDPRAGLDTGQRKTIIMFMTITA